MANYLKNNLVPIAFFSIYLVVGIVIFTDYGLSWDEPVSRNNGLVAYDYVFKGSSFLLHYTDRDYGTAFELPLVILEKALKLEEARSIYFMRHFFTFLLFLASVFIFYKLASEKFSSKFIGLLGALFLVLSPRIFADSFYNSKDIPVLAAFIFAIYTLIRFLKNPDWKWALAHALTSAFLIDIRLSGVLVPLMTMFFFGMEILFSLKQSEVWRGKLAHLFIYLVLLMFLVYAFWPYLWVDPINNFLDAWQRMSHWVSWNGLVFYFGGYTPASELPWHYIPNWILITTPAILVFLFISGFIFTISRLIKSFSNADWFHSSCDDYIILAWLLFPYASYLILRPAIYDSWRHFYFIYPAFLLFSLTGFSELFALGNFLRRVLIATATTGFISVFYFMIAVHPYQNLYFNEFVGGLRGAKGSFEMDYWALTFREGLEHIAKIDLDAKIPIYMAYGNERADILPEADGKRLLFVPDASQAKYIITNYRWHEGVYNDNEIKGKRLENIYNLKIDGVNIMSVLKVHQNGGQKK